MADSDGYRYMEDVVADILIFCAGQLENYLKRSKKENKKKGR